MRAGASASVPSASEREASARTARQSAQSRRWASTAPSSLCASSPRASANRASSSTQRMSADTQRGCIRRRTHASSSRMASPAFERLLTAARDTRSALDEPLRRELAERLASAEQATPGVSGDPYEFGASLLALLGASAEPRAELGALHVEDMYFVWALANHDRAALARLEREFLAPLARRVSAARDLPPGELEQNVRTRLLVGEGDAPPRIGRYAGRGPFGAWLRMVAKRVALDLLRARGARNDRELESP